MAEITVDINGKAYPLACADGDEERLRNLAGYVGVKVEELVGKLGPVSETRLLLMAALLITDELQDKHGDITFGGFTEDAVADMIESIANDIEGISSRISEG